MIRTIGAGIALLALATATPAAAVKFDLFMTGTLAGRPDAVPVTGLNFRAGDIVSARWRFNSDSAVAINGGPVGGQGGSRFFTGVVSQGKITIAGNGGVNPISITQSATSRGAIYVVDNGGATGAPGFRFDQIVMSDGLYFSGGLPNFGYSLAGAAPANLYLSVLLFGRSQPGSAAFPPNFVDGLDLPDLVNQWQPYNPPVLFQLSFRAGTPGSPAAAAILPTSSFGVDNQSGRIVFLDGVPEPKTWAMLITGFGLVGAAMRRRAATPAAAARV